MKCEYLAPQSVIADAILKKGVPKKGVYGCVRPTDNQDGLCLFPNEINGEQCPYVLFTKGLIPFEEIEKRLPGN